MIHLLISISLTRYKIYNLDPQWANTHIGLQILKGIQYLVKTLLALVIGGGIYETVTPYQQALSAY